MKTSIIFCCLILIFNSVFGQSKIPKHTKRYVKNCADSINRLELDDTIHYFLYNVCLDYQKQYWIDLHHPLPLRKLIVDKVTNQKAIKLILFKYKDTLDEPCSPCIETKEKPIGLTYYSIPLIKESFVDLLRNRLYEIKYH